MADEKSQRDQQPVAASGGERQSRGGDGRARRPQTREGTIRSDVAQTIRTMDRWFDTQLNKLYAEVVSEPLPKEFLDLVEKLREKKAE